MARRTIVEAFKGFLPKRQEQIEELSKNVALCDSLRTITAGRNWSVMQGILDGFKREAVRELGTRNLDSRGWERINHRMELLIDIEHEMLGILNRGDAAREILTRLQKEKENGGRA